MKNEVGFTSQGTPGSWQRPNRLFLTPQKGPAWWTDTLISGFQPLEPQMTHVCSYSCSARGTVLVCSGNTCAPNPSTHPCLAPGGTRGLRHPVWSSGLPRRWPQQQAVYMLGDAQEVKLWGKARGGAVGGHGEDAVEGGDRCARKVGQQELVGDGAEATGRGGDGVRLAWPSQGLLNPPRIPDCY